MQDCMQYEPFMKDIKSDIFEKVLTQRNSYEESEFNEVDIKKALNAEYLNENDLKALLSSKAENFIDEIVLKAAKVQKKYFGNCIFLFTPLYLSNFCASKCVYCGFQKGNNIARAKLSEEEIEEELQIIAKSGLEELLLLTGEGREFASVEYISKACKMARKYFKVVGVEIYPLNVDEYEILHKSGCDYVTIFQETYNPQKYEKLHLAGEKRVMPYRFNGQERALRAGMRGVAFGALLGIDDFRKDALSCALHAFYLQKLYPHAEISISVPRLRPIINNNKIRPKDVSEKRLLQVLCAYRLFLPFANLVISSRERAGFRDEVIKYGATKMSAGVSVGIGEHRGDKKGDNQFEIADNRDVKSILKMLNSNNFQAVMSDSIYVG
ncbi:2-iminoacetate synthase ThiH [Campylobacter sp. LR291e]|uniref:2-iminoacetate synthase ThiH n=1 Tax=unclassified Campylobacter TaxID=2593542 RepID=UPI00123A0B46|nr:MULTISPECIES: 2-iminoacetate synthase ThiH [unclassified Campylobacter]KAA6230153.1 2-iminoacetate synthase ThiH [Campylobacter sp. LR291e]KAA6233674.1 2-iminoacetate synthase ThiH [Campylobacter sp. LR264d]